MSQQLIESILVGKIVAGKYQIKKMLGAGAMGYVFLAEHVQLKKPRALKILRDEYVANKDTRKRFLREISVTHALGGQNEHIIKIYDDYGYEDGVVYYVMEYLQGDSLEERIQKAPNGLPLTWCLKIASDTCEGMETVHREGVIHRDLKPSNIQLTIHRGEADFVKILDFGIAHTQQAGSNLTKTGSTMGTPLYMSPEQIMGMDSKLRKDRRPIDKRADIYALGCILFEMLSGRPPFQTENTGPLYQIEILNQHINQQAPLVREIREELPEEIDEVLQKALQKNPDDRYQSMEAFAKALLNVPAVESTAVTSSPPSPDKGYYESGAPTVLDNQGKDTIVHDESISISPQQLGKQTTELSSNAPPADTEQLQATPTQSSTSPIKRTSEFSNLELPPLAHLPPSIENSEHVQTSFPRGQEAREQQVGEQTTKEQQVGEQATKEQQETPPKLGFVASPNVALTRDDLKAVEAILSHATYLNGPPPKEFESISAASTMIAPPAKNKLSPPPTLKNIEENDLPEGNSGILEAIPDEKTTKRPSAAVTDFGMNFPYPPHMGTHHGLQALPMPAGLDHMTSFPELTPPRPIFKVNTPTHSSPLIMPADAPSLFDLAEVQTLPPSIKQPTPWPLYLFIGVIGVFLVWLLLSKKTETIATPPQDYAHTSSHKQDNVPPPPAQSPTQKTQSSLFRAIRIYPTGYTKTHTIRPEKGVRLFGTHLFIPRERKNVLILIEKENHIRCFFAFRPEKKQLLLLRPLLKRGVSLPSDYCLRQ